MRRKRKKSENLLDEPLPSGSVDVELIVVCRATSPCTAHSPMHLPCKIFSIHQSTHECNLFLTLRIYIHIYIRIVRKYNYCNNNYNYSCMYLCVNFLRKYITRPATEIQILFSALVTRFREIYARQNVARVLDRIFNLIV